jgi:hypothetical protein
MTPPARAAAPALHRLLHLVALLQVAALTGCEIGTFDSTAVQGTATAAIANRSTNYDATGGRDPRDLRIACERYGLPQEKNTDTVHIGFADPLAQTGRVSGVDLVMRIRTVGGVPSISSGELTVWDGVGFYQADLTGGKTTPACMGGLGNYDPAAGDVVFEVKCNESEDGNNDTGPPIGFSGDLHHCSLAAP